ncbi:hypothetical protein Mgra_00006282 [Meloidogyne graminicola]|uniref:Uncharacterized protein n=1 Tax=Meloidogyne graminicola TaxID=189291 RepID=A0A8S9ZML7_9BILA|nr:hypothetical protein Mgra_00006282 [Meloidogyne graminicola]
MQPPFAWNSSVIQSNDICFTSDNSTTSTKLISQTSPNSSSSFNAPPPQYYNSENVHYYTSHSNTQQTQEERTLQRGEINNQLINQQPNCAWGVINTQMQHNFVPTPSTPIPAIYSGTSPSPPQRFGIGGVGGGAR